MRAILAEEIKHLDCVPAHVVKALARDVETIVSVPILEYSPLLSETDLMEIIAEGKVHAVLQAIAKRRPLSANIADAVVSSLDIPAVSALLANPDAAIRERTLDAIIDQAERISVWQNALAMRSDLSRRAVKTSGVFRLDRTDRAAGQAPPSRRRHKQFLNRQVARRTEEGELGTSANHAAFDEVEAAAKAGKLDENFVEGAAEGAKREVVVLALAKLAGIPDRIVRRICSPVRPSP